MEQHAHTLQENVNENLSFKQSICGAAYYEFIGDSFAKQLLLNTLQQEQWLVPLVEHPTSYTKPSKGLFRTYSYIPGGTFAKIVNGFKYFRKKLHLRYLTWVLIYLCSLSAKV